MPKTQPVADLSEFTRGRIRATRCIVGRALDALGEQDRVNVEAALADAEYTSISIAMYLDKRDLPTSDRMVGDHRRGTCCCARARA